MEIGAQGYFTPLLLSEMEQAEAFNPTYATVVKSVKPGTK